MAVPVYVCAHCGHYGERQGMASLDMSTLVHLGCRRPYQEAQARVKT